MKKIDYLKLVIQHNLDNDKSWFISAFSITKENVDEYKSNPYYLRLVSQSWGYSFVNDKAELEKIEDSKAGEPLFKFSDILNVDSTWLDSIDTQIETTIGRLLINHICLYQSFGKKYKYINKSISVSDVENFIASKLNDTPKVESERSETKFYVDEYIRFVDSLQYVSTLSQLCVWAATPKGITAPTGIKAFKKDLLTKYEGKLTNPVELANFETELKNFDSEYLKDDPANGTFLSGKVKNIARKKMFLTIGADAGLKESLTSVTVTNSLEEGWPTDPVQFSAMMNGLRAGSFSRGAETVNGGVSAKILLRAGNNFKIVDTDCDSKLTFDRSYTDNNKLQLINRYIIDSNKLTLVDENNLGNYLGKTVRLRSPIYCKLPGDNICKICAGLKLFKFPTGVTIPLTEISNIILTSSLKRMHGTVLSTRKLDLTTLVS